MTTNVNVSPLDAATETDIMQRAYRKGGKAAIAKLRAMHQLADNQLQTAVGEDYWRYQGGYPGFVKDVRARVHQRTEAAVRLAYMEKLDAGTDPGPFDAPAPDATLECTTTLRLLIAARFPVSFGEIAARAQEARQEWGKKLAGMQDAGGSPHHNEAEYHLAAKSIDAVEFAHRCRQRVRDHGSHGTRTAALEAAMAGFAESLGSKVKAAIDRFGRDAVAAAITESALLGKEPWPDPAAANVGAVQSRIATIDGKLSTLGIDPANPPKTVGLLGQDLLKTRSAAVADVESAKRAATKRLADRVASILDRASAGDAGAWESVGKQFGCLPSAFPDGFKDAWIGAAVEAFADPVPVVEALAYQPT